MSECYKVTIDGNVYELAAGENLLQALLSMGCLIRHSCLAGACESCALYDVTKAQKVLACQHSVQEPLVLTSHMPVRYDVPCQICAIEDMNSLWCLVTVMTPMHFELGAEVVWQLGLQTGRSFCCSVEAGMVTFVIPKPIEHDLATLKLANTLSRSKLDSSTDCVVLASVNMGTVAQRFITALQAQDFPVAAPVIPLDLANPLVGYELKRFAQAFILSDLPIALTDIEHWLAQGKVRLSQPIYLTMSSE